MGHNVHVATHEPVTTHPMVDDPSLPGVSTPRQEDDDPIVLHVDADCFYAACERLREPGLEDEPVVVGMGYEPGDTIGAVATASYEARAYGVESAQPISTALERLPRRADVREADDPETPLEESGYYRPVDMEHYKSVSSEVKAILHDCADVVRDVSVDEAYLDVSARTAWSVVDGFARHVKQRISREVGIDVSIGVGPSMSVAKIASDFDKPDGLTVVHPEDVQSFLAPLPVDDLHGVGPVTARELRSMGLETAGDVAGADPDPLLERFGERGRDLYERARGNDERAVEPKGLPKSFSRESAFDGPVEDPEPKHERVVRLAEAVAARAQREGALYRTVGVKAVLPPFDVNTREQSLPGPVDDPDLVVDIALELFEEFDHDPVRKLGVKVANLEFSEAEQPSFDDIDWERGQRQETDSSVDEDTEATDRPDGQLALDALAAHVEDSSAGSSGSPSRTDAARECGDAADNAQRSLDEFSTEDR